MIMMKTRMAAANKVSKLIIGKGGFLSTPAVSNLIRFPCHHQHCLTHHQPSWSSLLPSSSPKYIRYLIIVTKSITTPIDRKHSTTGGFILTASHNPGKAPSIDPYTSTETHKSDCVIYGPRPLIKQLDNIPTKPKILGRRTRQWLRHQVQLLQWRSRAWRLHQQNT